MTMTLLGVEKVGEEHFWLYSAWRLTYRVGWDNICRAVSLIYQYTEKPELFAGDAGGEREFTVNDAKEILDLEEMGYLTIRGTSKMLHAPVMITFYNQLDTVRMSVLSVNEEFAEADYRKFNLSTCQFMDSVELAMYS